ncbi:MAG: hypothetical protein K2P94_11735 [Rhodospirillaceae bacterium]|nr:hypothetical protein [Rhodospirillaceae bacterium]
MNTRPQNFRLGNIPFRLLAAGMTAMIFFGPVLAADNAAAPGADLQSAYEDAAHDARLSDDLDPAYELLGIAETAHMQNFPQVAAKAATAFADLVKRATIKALKTGGSVLEDTLDQFVDLRFVARSANLPLPQAALDDAMTSLFPTVSAALQRKIDDAGPWDDKLKYATDLGDLQASATQILKEDIAGDIGEAFDRKTAQLETLAAEESDEAERIRMQEGLAKARKSRVDRIVDANVNNMNVVAALLQSEMDKSFDGGARQRGEVEVPEDMQAGVGSCIETGLTGKQDPIVMRGLQLDCINSGRLPTQGRCPTENLSFLCYGATPSMEKMTYVYRGTPDELYFQHKCSAANVLKADQVPPSGASFRTANAALAFTCAPPAAE